MQDEVRYLGFESGIAAYKPNSPKTVLDRRYGDCKDKSLLLATLLQQLGVESYPVLVNSVNNKNMDEFLPSHYVFDHCFVYLKHNNRDYFIDPTISNQGGDLARINTPDYKFGLLLKEGANGLTPIKKEQQQSLFITEDIAMDSLDGSAIFTVISEYRGSKADYMRAYFNNSTKENIHKEYLNFYSVLYPSISLNEDVSFVDDARPWENIFTTHESYTIETPWSNSDNGEGSYLETYSLVLESLVNYAKSAKREMPYYLGEPFTFEQVTRISLPEPWFIQNEDTAVDDESFSYRRDVKSLGILVTISRAYALKKKYIEGKDTPIFNKTK